MLFRPFDLEKWMALGFSAWLANLLSSGGGGGGTRLTDDSVLESADNLGRDGASAGEAAAEGWAQIQALWQQAWNWLTSHPWILAGILTLGVILVMLLILLTWISSRAKFVFLDNVVENRAWIKEPWGRLGSLGDSLFAFRVGFGFLNLVITLVFVGAIGAFVWSMIGHGNFTGMPVSWWATAAIACLVMFVYGLAVMYIDYFLEGFVVPIMYRTGLTVMPAWNTFSTLLRQRAGTLLLSGLFAVLLHLIAVCAIVIFGFLTCCIGFIALAIPYIGTVLMLPLFVTYRLFTVELLGDLDSDLKLLTEPSTLNEPAPAT
ncbi:MAG: hypothetical protein AAGC60_05340 [Acidobacteriota bacterium]